MSPEKYNKIGQELTSITFQIIPAYRSKTVEHRLVWAAYKTCKLRLAPAVKDANINCELQPLMERAQHRVKSYGLGGRKPLVLSEIMQVQDDLRGALRDSNDVICRIVLMQIIEMVQRLVKCLS